MTSEHTPEPTAPTPPPLAPMVTMTAEELDARIAKALADKAEADEAARIAALPGSRQALSVARPRKSRVPVEMVTVRITKAGDGHVCTGAWDAEENCSAKYDYGDIIQVEKATALSLEAKHYAEIQD